MLVQPIPTAPVAPDADIEAGIIEDARARQRQQRGIAAALLISAAIGVGAFLGLGGGGNGSHGGPGVAGHSSGDGGPGGGPHLGGSNYSAAPPSQPGRFDRKRYEFVCSLAPANRYLPARSGCVSVKYAVLGDDGRQDLVLLFANLGRVRVDGDYVPLSWTLETVRGTGQISRSQVVSHGAYPVVFGLANVNGVPGDEIFLQPTTTSSGSPVSVYSFANNALHLAGTFVAGGDSATRERYFCRAKPTPRMIQQTMELLGPTIYGTWRWTTTTYLWRGPTLRRMRQSTVVRTGLPKLGSSAFGEGCGK